MGTNVRDFFLRVLPWPSDDEPGYINVHYMARMPNGQTPWFGNPTRDVDGFLQSIHSASTFTTPPDVYMCLSRQAHTKISKKGQVRAAKSLEGALALKAIWYDVDVGKADGYPTVTAAVAAVRKMCTAEGLPRPTAWVSSGGGLHVYWISNRALMPDEWQPYAEGLKQLALKHNLLGKGDYGVTTDRARVLRPPGTYNRKQAQPRPVTLLDMKDTDYDFATSLVGLTTHAATLPRPAHASLPGRPASVFASVPIESLAEGIGREPLPPLDPKPLVKECGWFKEALTTGGKDFSQGLWNLTTLAATFLEHGNGLAHRMARGHPEYHHDQTEALWERKLAERRDHRLGWPSCRSIQGEGCTHCAACPHLATGKSPLNLCRVPATNRMGPVAPGVSVAAFVGTSMAGTPLAGTNALASNALIPVTTPDLPDGFIVQGDIIYKVVDVKVKGQPNNTEYWPMFHCSLYSPWAQSGPDALNFVTTVDKGSVHDVSIALGKMTTLELEHELLNGRVKPVADSQKYMKGLMVSWLAKLHAAAAAQSSAPFGWHMTGNVCDGFSYGSVLYKSDGTRGPVGKIDPQLKKIYEPIGDVQPWNDAFQMILDQKRPGLEAIVAAAFGSCLMYASGEYVGMFSVWGDSGGGKSTAMRIALAVWGNPKMAKENEGATEKSVLHRLGQIRNLPYMWDEIKDEQAQTKVYTLLFRSGGKDNSRLNSDVQQRATGEWENIIGIAANKSFADFVVKKNPDTTAGLVRLFEWREMKPAMGAIGQLSPGEVGRKLRALDDNYGEMGKRWAAFLGANRDLCSAHMSAASQWFEDAVRDPTRNTQEERFWVAFCAAVLSGAELANEHLGLAFDIPALRAFLVAKLLDQRRETQEDQVEGGSFEWTENLLTAFIKAYHRNTLRTTSGSVQKRGCPVNVEILPPTPERGFATHIHWVLNTSTLLISQRELYAWLKGQNSESRLMKYGLKKHYNATFPKATLGAGTTYRELGEILVNIPVAKDTALWNYMMQTPETGDAPDNTPPPASVLTPTDDTAGMFANADAPKVA